MGRSRLDIGKWFKERQKKIKAGVKAPKASECPYPGHNKKRKKRDA